jgi:hypothetical protein
MAVRPPEHVDEWQRRPGLDPAEIDVCPVTVEMNRNRFYMEGRNGILELRFSVPAAAADVAFACEVNCEMCHWGSEPLVLRARGSRVSRVQVKPICSGEVLLDILVECRLADQTRAFTGQHLIRVLEPTVTPQSLSITIDQSMRAEGSVYGASIRNQADDLIKKGFIRTNNDLLEQQFADNWQRVDLYPTNPAAGGPPRREVLSVRVVPSLPRRGDSRERAGLVLDDAWAPGRILLLGQQQVRFGRQREVNDVVLRFVPKSPENDEKTGRISREQMALSLQADGLVLTDLSSGQTTRLNGKPVGPRGAAVPLDRPSDVDAGALRLRVWPFLDGGRAAGADSAARYTLLGGPDEVWRTAERLGLRSVRVDRVGNAAEDESYLLVYRWAGIGRSEANEVPLPGAELEDVAVRLVRLGRQLWVESLSGRGVVRAGGAEVGHGFAGPLSVGLPIQVGPIPGRVTEFAQFAIGS